MRRRGGRGRAGAGCGPAKRGRRRCGGGRRHTGRRGGGGGGSGGRDTGGGGDAIGCGGFSRLVCLLGRPRVAGGVDGLAQPERGGHGCDQTAQRPVHKRPRRHGGGRRGRRRPSRPVRRRISSGGGDDGVGVQGNVAPAAGRAAATGRLLGGGGRGGGVNGGGAGGGRKRLCTHHGGGCIAGQGQAKSRGRGGGRGGGSAPCRPTVGRGGWRARGVSVGRGGGLCGGCGRLGGILHAPVRRAPPAHGRIGQRPHARAPLVQQLDHPRLVERSQRRRRLVVLIVREQSGRLVLPVGQRSRRVGDVTRIGF
mmetsp:Transcript_27407/g.87104  ORF Transcript_27407/g.87104 Transcript_27407/m.87104 type:complete len:309 (+) Transcript_27407:3113-4039(+)